MEKKISYTFMERMRILFFPFTDSRFFKPIVGVVSLLNPFALVPQLWNCIVAEKLIGVSATMYALFALLQFMFMLVAIKDKNLLMFLSMVLSILISITIIVLVILK
jgi:hypothetical protein